MSVNTGRRYARLLGGAAVLALSAGIAQAEPANFNIAPQPLALAVGAFSEQSGRPVLLKPELADKLSSKGVSGSLEPELALAEMLSGTGLTYRKTGDTFLIESASNPQSGSAAGDGADAGTVQALIVTAQKKEEAIQDVPIAISAFTEKALQEQKIEGGFDLLKAIPNVTFSKNNFTSYNFSIRGIGTKAVSATTDPGVAVSFNNITLIQNRLFEQEYFDVERVEVLRGPQGTLYGRNATAGVINVISAKPNLHEFDGWVKGEVGNYHTKRLSAMVNMPLVEDKLALRIAGALTDRQGYDFNAGTHHAVNGRDLWSARVTLAFNPTERIRSNLVWERFNEDDNRSRTGKQLCHRDPGPTQIGSGPNAVSTQQHNPDLTLPDGSNFGDIMLPALFSQGCKPGSLYNDSAFGTPNGLALPFVFAMLGFGADCGQSCFALFPLGIDPSTGRPKTLIELRDPYGGMMQSRDLRTIQSFRDPKYTAKADVVELNLDVDVADHLTFTSQTAYDKDQVYSFQDYNRFNTVPIFADTSQLVDRAALFLQGISIPSGYKNLAPGGKFCDPQLGCSDSLAGFDISRAKSSQFTQEMRLQSNFDGPLNFSVGADYTKFDVLVDYFVFYNLITAFATMPPLNFWDVWRNASGEQPPSLQTMFTGCPTNVQGLLQTGELFDPPIPQDDPQSVCAFIDTTPIESLAGDGHNYFRSKNPYRLKSSALFGELYWRPSDALKITAGLRYNDDRKTFTPVPSQILLANAPTLGGSVNRGYPALPDIKQHWGEWTGRLGVDWKPHLSFTDQTMIYAFYSRGYKGGGANPPTPGFGTTTIAGYLGIPAGVIPSLDVVPLKLIGVDYGPTFKPEFVNAYEVGAKNTLLGGAMTFNTDAFFYDYKDYQVSQIKDRTAINENFDAHIWGLEFETRFAPSRDFQVIANLGYLDTSIGKGMKSIDIMDRTAGNPDFVVMKPWVQLPSNCVVPVTVAQSYIQQNNGTVVGYWGLCGGVNLTGLGAGVQVVDPATGQVYDPAHYNGQNGTVNTNGGAGIDKNLSGNELPNSPHWTMNVGAQYGHDILDGWRATVRADAYWQSQSWARVYNDNPYDKLHGWYNLNLSVWFERPDDNLKIELYAKNILDKTPITDSFLNSDDTALTTNVFVLDPRLIGLSIHKGF